MVDDHIAQETQMPLAEAQAAIVAAGFRMGDIAHALSNVPSIQTPGIVFSQQPAPSPQNLPPGTLINLAVVFDNGAPQITVPNVVGQSDAVARQVIVWRNRG